MQFDGFLKVYEEGRDDRVARRKGQGRSGRREDNRRLPALAEGDKVTISGRRRTALHAAAAAVFRSDARQEDGRARHRPAVDLCLDDGRARRSRLRTHRKKRLVPEDKGRLVIAFLESFFKRYVEYDFTADLEEKLDLISDNKLAWKDVLRDFWRDFTGAVGEIKDLRVGEVLEALNESSGPHIFPARERRHRSAPMSEVRGRPPEPQDFGKYGAFIGCGNYPECNFTRQLDAERRRRGGKLDGQDARLIPTTASRLRCAPAASDPTCSSAKPTGMKSRSASSIPKGIDAATLDLEKALQLLSLPREVGLHPESGTPITAGLGRYGPFILHDGTYANVDNIEEVFSIGLNRAVTLLAEKRAGGGKSRFQRNAPKVLKDLGEHPSEGGKVQVLEGRYGPYVTHNKVNATVPKSKDATALTMDDAVTLLAERVAEWRWQEV